MDPYIEGQGWWGFHTQYVAQLQRLLAPLVRPRFVVYIEEHVYLIAASGEAPGRTRPDATVAERSSTRDSGARASTGGIGVLEAPITLRLPKADVEHQVYLEIRRRDTGRVVTVIELLSPINKERGPGRQEYLAKRAAFIESRAHLIELDLLRGGQRLPTDPPLPPASYYALVSRADQRPACGVWPIRLEDPLPTIPVPLTADAEPVAMDLQTAFDTVYDDAAFADMLDYAHGTEPPLLPEEATWAERLLAQSGR